MEIPESIDTPHISKDKRFYRRFNFQTVPLEEYEIRELYKRKSTSKLAIAYSNTTKIDPDNHNHTKFLFEVGIANIGDIVESNYKVNVYINNYKSGINISWEQAKSNYDYTWLDKGRVKVSATGIVPVFPDEQVNAIRFYLEVENNTLIEKLCDIQIEMKVYYTHGEDIVQTDLNKAIEIYKKSLQNGL